MSIAVKSRWGESLITRDIVGYWEIDLTIWTVMNRIYTPGHHEGALVVMLLFWHDVSDSSIRLEGAGGRTKEKDRSLDQEGGNGW